MTAGIPGTGISVLFYLLSTVVLLIDVVVAGRSHGVQAPRRKIAGLQARLLVACALSVGSTGWLLSWFLTQSRRFIDFPLDPSFALPLHPWVIGLGTLLVLLVGTESLGLWIGCSRTSVDPYRGETLVTSRHLWITLPTLVLLATLASHYIPKLRAQGHPDTYRTAGLYDDFAGDRLSSANWLVAHKQWGGDGANGGVVPATVRVAEGKLIIAAQGERYLGPIRGINRDRTPRADGKRVGGAIATRDYFASGRYEVRMKVMPRFGAVSAMWTFHYEERYRGEPQYVDKPVGSPDYYAVNHEIDIELPGRPGPAHRGFTFDRALFSTWVGENHDEHTVRYIDLGTSQNDGRFHTYRFDWHTGSSTQKKRVEFYVDDVLQQVIYTHVPTRAGRLWIGVWFPATWAGTPDFDVDYLEVDWVRITPFGEAGDRWHPETFPAAGWSERGPE